MAYFELEKRVSESETRVGHKAVAVLLDDVREYIVAHTVSNRFVGNLKYLTDYQQLWRYNNGR